MPIQYATIEKFKLRLLPDSTPEEIEKSRGKIRRDEASFRHSYFHEYTYGYRKSENLDASVLDLFEQLEIGAFWRVLSILDGCGNRAQPDSKELKKKKRTRARKNFNDYQLEELLNLCVNQALLPYEPSGNFPGYWHGHQILFDHLSGQEDSMFASVVFPFYANRDFIKRLNNGRFWEMLPLIGSGSNFFENIVEEVLTPRHYEDLDLGFVRKGFEIFLRNREHRTTFYLSRLSSKAIRIYGDFFTRISDSKKLKKDELELLVGPYVDAVLSLDNCPESDTYEDLKFRDFAERLQEKSIERFVKSSEIVRKSISNSLFRMGALKAQEVLPYVKNPEEMLTRVLWESSDFAKKILNGGEIPRYRKAGK